MTPNKLTPKKPTPLMKQYAEIKRNHPKDLLLFRMGDFYELFGDDAKTASDVLNITLTQRNKKSGDETLMCGFPHHSKDGPINRLLSAGYSVALCDQLEDAKDVAKGSIVKRGVTLILSPGVVYDPFGLDRAQTHEILCFNSKEVSWLEPSTGLAFFKSVECFTDILQMVLKINPKEIVVYDEEQASKLKDLYKGSIVLAADRSFLSTDFEPKNMLISYVKGMQGEHSLFGFENWVEVKTTESLKMNLQFLKHLEVFETNEGHKDKCIFNVIKKTKTPGGSRLLRRMLSNPIKDKDVLTKRQKNIKEWYEGSFSELEDFRRSLHEIGDFERRATRAGHSLGKPIDLYRLKNSLKAFVNAFMCVPSKNVELSKALSNLVSKLDSALVDDISLLNDSKVGGIKKAFDEKLDEFIDISVDSQRLVLDLEERERSLTGINTLKVRFNSVFGYYIEVTKTHKDKVPERYMRKQTLTNAERYSTDELSTLEEKVINAKSKRLQLEKEIYKRLKDLVRSNLVELKKCILMSNESDLYSSMAFLMHEKSFSLPKFCDENQLFIKAGFHPVVSDDLSLKGIGSFVTNNLKIDSDNRLFLITGPNMAGKSTFMRMTVLCAYLAQCGLPVPAEEATLPIYNGLFTRIGASDVLSEGLSTFMVEMKETAEILNEADQRSLIVMDEIGRGTSSRDGEALAESLLKHISLKLKSHCLFATHYHELTDKVDSIEAVRNIHLGYLNKEGEIIFTYKIKKGASKNSYGIEVAKQAGLPSSVLEYAKKAASFELNSCDIQKNTSNDEFRQLEFSLSSKAPFWIEELKTLDLNQMTPVDALIKLSKWKEVSS